MKKSLILLIFGILIHSCSSSKIGNGKMRFYDENNAEISRSLFKKLRLDKTLIEVRNDSLNQKILTMREIRGKVNNLSQLSQTFEKQLNISLSKTEPTVIIYYFDKDPYNSSGGFVDLQWIKKWKDDLETGLNMIAEIKPIYLYKNFNGLEIHEGIIPWQKDPNNQVADLFFKYNYPMMGFVVISKNGNYISRFGEFGLYYVWQATEIMKE